MASWEDKVGSDTGSTDFVGTGSAAAVYGIPSSLAAVPVHITRAIAGPQTPEHPLNDPGLVSYDRAVSLLGVADTNTRAGYQQRLYESGFYEPKDIYTPGDFDDVTDKAWQKVVDKAAKTQKSIDEVLEEGKKKVNDQGGLQSYYKTAAMKGRDPLTIKLTNPDDLRAVAQASATKLLGRSFTESELTKFIASYHGAESSAQSADYASAGGGGGTVTQEASPDAAAAAFAEQAAPTEFHAHKKVQVMDTIMKLLGGVGPGAASPGAGGAATGV